MTAAVRDGDHYILNGTKRYITNAPRAQLFTVMARTNPDDPGAKMLGQIQMAVGAIPFFLQNLEDKVRKVRLVVKWRDAVADRTVILERFVTSLGVGQQAVKTDLPPDQVDPDDVAPKDDAPKDDAPKDTSK